MSEPASSSTVFDLRPMALADLFDAVVRLYRRHFGQLVQIAAIIYLPLGALQVASAFMLFQAMETTGPGTVLSTDTVLLGVAGVALWFVLFWFSMPLVQGAVAKAVAEYYLGGTVTLGGSYGFALRRWPTLIGIAFVNGLIVMAITLVSIAPGIALAQAAGAFSGAGWTLQVMGAATAGLLLFLAGLQVSIAIGVRLFFAALVALLEGEGTIASLVRSWELTRGHFWRLLVALGALWLMVTVLAGIIVWPAQIAAQFLRGSLFIVGQASVNALSATGQLFVQPIQIVGTVLLYYDLRMRKEGFDLVMMAEAIGEPELATRTREGVARAAAALYGGESPLAPPSNADGADHEP